MFSSERQKPEAIQCLWNSDWEYIGLTVELIFRTGHGFTKQQIVELSYGNFENTDELVAEARRIAKEYTDQYEIELYFPSPDQWSRDCPDWWEAESAPKCEDCQTPIVPSDSPYLPKEVCYPCHLKRESNQRIISDEPYDEGITMYLSKNGEFERIGYCSEFKSFAIAPFVIDKVKRQLGDMAITTVILDESDVLELNKDLERVLDEKAAAYTNPVVEEEKKHFYGFYKAKYKGIEYEFAERFNQEHAEMSRLIDAWNINLKAIENECVYCLMFKKGFTRRDDSFLRFVHYKCNGLTEIETLLNNYRKLLSEKEIGKTIQKLIAINCLVAKGNKLEITPAGRNIL